MESDDELLKRARAIAAERSRYEEDFASVRRRETANLPAERVDVLFDLVQRASKVKGELNKRGLDIPPGMDGRGLAASTGTGQQAITPSAHAPDESWKTATIIPIVTLRVAPVPPKPILGFRRKPSKEATQAASYADADLHHQASQDAFLNTLQLRKDCVTALAACTELSASIAGVRSTLRQAQRDFEETAFGPFWDSIERSAAQLGQIDAHYKQLEFLGDSYVERLRGRTHTFPPFPVSVEMVPKAVDELREFERLVRMGQRDFAFANIWEHRQTRKVLIAGFHSLAAAVGGVTQCVGESFSSLETILRSGLSELRSGQREANRVGLRSIREQSVTNSLLDDVKNGRTDVPNP